MTDEHQKSDLPTAHDEALRNARARVNGANFAYPAERGFEGTLSKRELFAAMIMQGLCANSIPGGHHATDRQASEAVMKADALLKELAR